MKITQQKIAKALDVSQPFISYIMTGESKIPWPMAERLADMFPGRSISEWKRATPAVLKRAFESLDPPVKKTA